MTLLLKKYYCLLARRMMLAPRERKKKQIKNCLPENKRKSETWIFTVNSYWSKYPWYLDCIWDRFRKSSEHISTSSKAYSFSVSLTLNWNEISQHFYRYQKTKEKIKDMKTIFLGEFHLRLYEYYWLKELDRLKLDGDSKPILIIRFFH